MVFEDYLRCSAYQGQTAHASEAGFAAFYHDASQRYFFALLDADGHVLLKSEGYPQVAARENGIQSVIKNRPNKDFFSVKEENGKYYLCLRAANHREIARSCGMESEADALALLPYTSGEKIRSGSATTSTSTAQSSVATTVAETTTTVETAAPVAAATIATMTSATAAEPPAEKEDDYLPCREYEGRHVNDKMNNVALFKHANGQFYFALYNADGSVRLRSEGFANAGGRDSELSGVLRNLNNTAMYSTIRRGAYFMTVLKDKTGREVGRSCLQKDEATTATVEVVSTTAAATTTTEAVTVATTAAVAASTIVGTVTENTTVVTTEAAPIAVASSVPPVEDEDDYLSCRHYQGHSVTDEANNLALFTHSDGQLYFVFYNADGNVRLRSEGFGSAAGRDSELSAALRHLNNPDMYATVAKGAYYMTVLRDETGREVGRSCLLKNDSVAPVVTTTTVTTAAAPVIVEGAVAKTTVTTVAAAPIIVEAAAGKTTVTTTTTRAASDAASAANVMAAPVIVRTLTEIVREAAPVVVEAAPVVIQEAVIAPPPAPPAPEPVPEVEDDYLPCREYEGRHVNDKVNNVSLFKHDNGQFYFAIYNADGSVRLRSEGFGTAGGRDSELSGVLKNLNNPDMYTTVRRGVYFMSVLKDKTGREVGRTCLHKDAPVVVVAPEVVAVEAPTVAPEVVTVAAAATVAAFAAPTVVEEVAVVVPEVIEVAPVVEAVVAPPPPPVVEKEKEDDYLVCGQYEGHEVTNKANNVALFQHANGQHYFAIYNADGSVHLRSEGFRSIADRDSELAGALSHLNDASMYSTVRRGIYYISVLKDKTGREVGRSCMHKDQPKVVTPIAPVVAVAAAALVAPTVVEAVTAPVAPPPPAPVVEKDVEDDYLPCRVYEGRHVNDKANNVALFKHEDGQFYFAVYNTDGSVRLRSEGFKTSRDRDSELSGVMKNLNNPDMYSTIRRGEYFITVLKDKTGREVGRSCLQKDAPKVVAAAPVVAPAAPVVAPAAVAAAALAAAATAAAATPSPMTTPKAAPVVKAPVVKAAAPIVETTAAVEEAVGSGFDWKWLLLPLLLLGAWWLFGKGCNGCNKETPAASVPTTTTVTPSVDTTRTVAPAAVASAATSKRCPACENSTDPIFTPVCDNPKKLDRLGSNPEFGNSHDLSPEQFYAKLKKAYGDNEVDKVFLDRIYKAMGYSGFADAKAEHFSAVVLPVGTTGKLGYSKAHKTGCYTLPDAEYHRKAFHIDAANGCDLHFMKTCGNHFFNNPCK